MHDPHLLDELSRLPTAKFDTEVYRATPQGLNALTPSTAGGRWSPRGSVPVLYTSLEKAGALAEISYHWLLLDPLPTKPVAVHRIKATAEQSLRLVEVDLQRLGVETDRLGEIPYKPSQDIGAAVAFLGYDGLIVPSARWRTENLVIFAENHSLAAALDLIASEDINWQDWARANGFL
jgi:RES domain-containing protein